MPHVATWIRAKDQKWFRRAFAKHPNVRLWNARTQKVPLEKMQGLLLSGGPDIAEEFLRQPVPDPSILDQDVEPERGLLLSRDPLSLELGAWNLELLLPLLPRHQFRQVIEIEDAALAGF